MYHDQTFAKWQYNAPSYKLQGKPPFLCLQYIINFVAFMALTIIEIIYSMAQKRTSTFPAV